MHYVHHFNVQIVEIVHTYRLYAGKMMGPPCDPSVHDVIGLHRPSDNPSSTLHDHLVKKSLNKSFACRSLREKGIRHSISRWWWSFPYHQTDGPHKPKRRWREFYMQWCWWACANWRRQDEGIGWGLWSVHLRPWSTKHALSKMKCSKPLGQENWRRLFSAMVRSHQIGSRAYPEPPGPLFTKKAPSYGFRDPHDKPKTVVRPS